MDKWKKYPKPLAGIDLKGVEIDELRKSAGPKVPNDFGEQQYKPDGERNMVYNYRDWVQLSAVGDGNCFLHSFAVFLTGKSDSELTQRLRVAICLEIMQSPGKYYSWGDDRILSKLKEVILKDDFTFDTYQLEDTHVEYLAHIFKRPLAVISKIPKEHQATMGSKYQYFHYPNFREYAQSSNLFIPNPHFKEWTIYNSGGHFQPLIPPKK